jgi:hypothetical protein
VLRLLFCIDSSGPSLDTFARLLDTLASVGLIDSACAPPSSRAWIIRPGSTGGGTEIARPSAAAITRAITSAKRTTRFLARYKFSDYVLTLDMNRKFV